MTWRLLDGVFFLRPLLLVPVWTVCLLGYGPPHASIFGEGSLWLALSAVTAACAAAFVLNQYFDIETDRHNRKCQFLPSGAISKGTAQSVYALLCLITLVLCALRPGPCWPAGAVILLGVLYSAPPWRWKDRPYLGLAANVLAHGLAVFLCGRLASDTQAQNALVSALPYVFGTGAAYLLTTLPDREGDAMHNKRTLAVTLGPERTARWALGWYLSAVLVALYQVDALFLVGVLPSAWWFVRAGRGDLSAAPGAVRWSVLGLSLAAAFVHLWYAPLLLAGWFATRTYYARRWNLQYP